MIRCKPSESAESPEEQGLTTLCIVDRLEDLSAYRDQWTELRSCCQGAASVSSFETISSWWKTFGPELTRRFGKCKLQVLLIFKSSGLIGAIPCYQVERNAFVLKPKQLIGFGIWPAGSYETMCEESTALVRDGFSEDVATTLKHFVSDSFRLGKLDLARVLWNCSLIEQSRFESSLDGLSKWADLKVREANSVVYIRLAESWTAHRQVISRSMRDNLAYYPKLLKRNGHEWQVRLIVDPSDTAKAVDNLTRLHIKRSLHETMRLHKIHIDSNRQQEYLKLLFKQAVSAGGGFIGELLVDDEVIASQAFITYGQTLTNSYSGFDPDWSKFSPLFILNSQVFQAQMEQGIRRLNFLTVPGQWQLRWGPGEEEAQFTSLFISTRRLGHFLCVTYLARRVMRTKVSELVQHARATSHDYRRWILKKLAQLKENR